jgi:hypothetical protein
MHIKTKLIDLDEGFRLARNIELSIESKEVATPKKALSASQDKYHNETVLKNDAIRGLIEVYRHIDREKLHRMMTENSHAAKFGYEVSSSLREVKPDKEITIGIVEYDGKGEVPDARETSFLLDILNNPRLDVATTPILPKLTCENYIKFLDRFVEVYQSSTFLPALAPCIPHYSSLDIANLFEYYAKKDVFENNFICVDFNGSNPISQYMFVSLIVREAIMLEKDFGQPIFLHAVNLKYGKATRKQIAVPAKDLIIFTMGFNSFGANHKIVPISSAIGAYELKTKLLNRADYGYYSLNIAKNIIDDARGAYEIKLGDVLSNEKVAKFFNAERQGLEATKISEVITEHELKTYIESKTHMRNEHILEKVRKVHENALQKRL